MPKILKSVALSKLIVLNSEDFKNFFYANLGKNCFDVRCGVDSNSFNKQVNMIGFQPVSRTCGTGSETYSNLNYILAGSWWMDVKAILSIAYSNQPW